MANNEAPTPTQNTILLSLGDVSVTADAPTIPLDLSGAVYTSGGELYFINSAGQVGALVPT